MNAIQRGVPPEKIGLEVQKAMFTYAFYWSFIQIGFGLYVIKLLGGWGKVKKVYSRDDLLEKPLRSIDLIVGLVVLTIAIIWGMQFASAMLSCGSWEVYMQYWQGIVAGIPWNGLSKLNPYLFILNLSYAVFPVLVGFAAAVILAITGCLIFVAWLFTIAHPRGRMVVLLATAPMISFILSRSISSTLCAIMFWPS